jgi:hypothetical protein
VELTRRQAVGLLATSATSWAAPEVAGAIVRRHDEALANLLKRQVTDSGSRWRGGCPDAYELHHVGSAGALIAQGIAAYLHPQSKFHQSSEAAERIKLAAGFLDRSQNEQGNIDLLVTNFNSPPDTGFVVHQVATGAVLAQRAGAQEFVRQLEGFLRQAGSAMTVGGVHTPNHRWVICSALAQINELFPDERYLSRIDEWLTEGIDIDADGQWTERSTLVYNIVSNRAFLVMAEKLGRPELADPVRRNLEAMLYLLHPGDELVTEISRRQDQYQRGSVGKHWFALKSLGLKDSDGRLNGLANRHRDQFARLTDLMEYPQLTQEGAAAVDVPDHYEQVMPVVGIARIRRGTVSATVVLEGDSRFFTFRRGQAIIRAVRFASAFFGKGQFVPREGAKAGARYVMRQSLTGPYYQPFDPARKVEPREWDRSRPSRERSEVCDIAYEASVEEFPEGFDVRVQATGTKDVPLAVEINLGGDGELRGCVEAPSGGGAMLMAAEFAEYREGADTIRFGPALREHGYTQVRGAQDKLPGRSVYLTAYTPVDHVIQFRWG